MNKSRGPYIGAIQSSLHGVGIHCVEDWDFVSLTLTSSLLLKLLHISLVSMYTTVADFLLHVHPSKVDTITLSTRITINFKWNHINSMQYIHMKLSVFYFRIESLSNDITIYVHSIVWAQWKIEMLSLSLSMSTVSSRKRKKKSVTVVYYYIAVRRWQTFMCPLLYMYLINKGRRCLSILSSRLKFIIYFI